MPKAKSVELFMQSAPSAFVSPFSDRPPVSFYSSIVIPGNDKNDCLPCAITALSRSQLEAFISELGGSLRQLPLPSLTLNQTVPVIPDPPSNAVDAIELDFLASLPIYAFLRPTSFSRIDSEAVLGATPKSFWTHAGGATLSGFTVTTTDSSNVDIFWGKSAAPTIAASGVAQSVTYA
jgi:hypothetical protein